MTKIWWKLTIFGMQLIPLPKKKKIIQGGQKNPERSVRKNKRC